MLRAALHVLVSWSMIAGPPETRSYAGDEAVGEGEAPTGTEAPTDTEAPTGTEVPASTEAPTPATEAVSEPPATTPAVTTPIEPEGPADEDDADDELPYDPLVDSPEAQRARSWVRGGAVFLGIGGALTIGAIAMSQAKVNTLEDQNACDPRNDLAGNGCQEGARDRAAVAIAIPGALLLAGGIAMLTAGKLQQKRLRASLRASRRDVMLGLQWAF